ncbi:hypothetical protein INT43_000813 [Umbelopsis isabellina]|uniref:non-specific serine/threonine protein kinase n=1 Tax=Mortierella isabellina TaxID=91625 RepID=A0A8H7Q3K2_MORIS|nr:hypothetical protein INT43_000813 [Umbelopsis isabellina]
MEIRVGNKYKLGRKIGAGSFGEIYLGTNTTNGEDVAIKLESVRAAHPQLEYEARVYKTLAGGVGIPFIRWFGRESDHNVMVMDLLGPSMEDLFNFCKRRFSLKTVLLLADQLLSRVEYCHSKGFIHRDIKPDNFLMGVGKRGNQVNMIDFGLAKRYRDPKTNAHIPYKENKNLTGTPRYASVNTHLGIEQSRRDDLESLGYILIYFCRGSLPWQGIRAKTKKEKYDKIMEKKMTTPSEQLCRGLHPEFALYLNYIRSLRFDDKPDYSYLRKLFRDLFVREGFQYDYVFDWTIKKMQEKKQTQGHLETNSSLGLDPMLSSMAALPPSHESSPLPLQQPPPRRTMIPPVLPSTATAHRVQPYRTLEPKTPEQSRQLDDVMLQYQQQQQKLLQQQHQTIAGMHHHRQQPQQVPSSSHDFNIISGYGYSSSPSARAMREEKPSSSSRVLRSQAKTANMSSTSNLVPQSTQQQFMTPPSYHDGISSYLQEAAAVDPNNNNWGTTNDHQNRTLPPVPTTSRSYHMMASSQRQYEDF